MFIKKPGASGDQRADYEHTSLQAGDYVFKKADSTVIFKRKIGDKFFRIYFENFEFEVQFEGKIAEHFLKMEQRKFSRDDMSLLFSTSNLVPYHIMIDTAVISQSERSSNSAEGMYDYLWILEHRKEPPL